MHSISRIRYSVPEARTLFGDLLLCPSVDEAHGPEFIAGREVALPRGANSRAAQVAMVIWVPPALKHKLAEWSAADISYENHETHNLLHNWVFAANHDSVAWLRFLGFTVHTPEPHGPYAQLFRYFCREAV